MQNWSYGDGERKSDAANGFLLWSCGVAIERRMDVSGFYTMAIAVV
jgi:hypothetical protein